MPQYWQWGKLYSLAGKCFQPQQSAWSLQTTTHLFRVLKNFTKIAPWKQDIPVNHAHRATGLLLWWHVWDYAVQEEMPGLF
jgi:hypothetical protein